MMNTYTNEELFSLPMGEPELDISWGIIPRRETVIPDWMHELQIEWHPNYDNCPTFQCLTIESPFEFARKPIWKKARPSVYQAVHEDGRLEQHVHSGLLTWDEEQYAWISTQDRGYAGRSFSIWMDPESDTRFEGLDRNKVILRGPWRVGPPHGWAEMHSKLLGVDTCYTFGLELSWAAIANCFYHFFPDHQLALVKRSNHTYIQPLHPEYGVPKYLISARRMDNANNRK